MLRSTCHSRLLLASALAVGCARSPNVSRVEHPAARAIPASSQAGSTRAAPTRTVLAPVASTPLASTQRTPASAPSSAGPNANANANESAPPVRAEAAEEEREIAEVEQAFRAPLPQGPLARSAPAFVVSNLSARACLSELRRRNLPVERDAGAADGVSVPVRIKGSMQGVQFVTPSRKSVFGKLDCRLALALDELSKVLARHDVVRVRVDNLYRPHARLAGTHTRSQHRYGLAVDLVSFELAGGLVLSVETDWRGALETPPCGPESRVSEATESAITLRNIVCDVAKSGLFHHILTPNFNAAHRDHLHLDIKRGDTRWVVE
jgi:hypothetical protein